jgi:hypothetical protein
VRYRAVGEDGVLVHLDNGRVLTVNAVGLHIVQALREPCTRSDLAASVADSFEISRQQAEADLDTFLQDLEAEQVLRYSV